MMFRWTQRRDRELIALRDDLFTYAECARILGKGCTAEDAKARMKLLRTGAQTIEDTQRGVRYEPQAPLTPVIGQDHASIERPATEGGQASERSSAPVPRHGKLPLPRFGEMEKRFDPVAQRIAR